MRLTLRAGEVIATNTAHYDPQTLLHRDSRHLDFTTTLPKRFGRRAFQLLTHPKFRAGYDFLLARGQIEGGDLLELAQWWTHFQHADNGKQKGMLNALRRKLKVAQIEKSVNVAQRRETQMHKEHVYSWGWQQFR